MLPGPQSWPASGDHGTLPSNRLTWHYASREVVDIQKYEEHRMALHRSPSDIKRPYILGHFGQRN
jgi:hypothetical protein